MVTTLKRWIALAERKESGAGPAAAESAEFIADELPKKGITAGEDKVQRLCRNHGIWSVFSKKRGLNRKPGPPVHDDLVERDFTAVAPNGL